VDIRIRRTVRATGFQGNAFENLLGPSRYRWMCSLGNSFVQTHTGPKIQIADPSAAHELLDLAIDAARRKQRLLFFCACRWPKYNRKIACHRTTVAGLLLRAAKRRGVSIDIVEWPGGEPKQIDRDEKPQIFAAVCKGRMTVPLGKKPDLAEVAGLPWCSVATLHSAGSKLHRVVGPAIRKSGQWVLPVVYWFFDPAAGLAEYEKEAAKLRKGLGLESASV
jgi:hypothetical protein